MLEIIKLSLICVLMDAETNNSYLDQITLYKNRVSQEKKVKVNSYYSAILSQELTPWEFDYENTTVYTTTKQGMIVFTMPYNYMGEDIEQLDLKEKNAVLNYFINPETLKIRQTYVEPESEPLDNFGYCINNVFWYGGKDTKSMLQKLLEKYSTPYSSDEKK